MKLFHCSINMIYALLGKYFEVLHTQGYQWLIEEIEELINEGRKEISVSILFSALTRMFPKPTFVL